MKLFRAIYKKKISRKSSHKKTKSAVKKVKKKKNFFLIFAIAGTAGNGQQRRWPWWRWLKRRWTCPSWRPYRSQRTETFSPCKEFDGFFSLVKTTLPNRLLFFFKGLSARMLRPAWWRASLPGPQIR